MCPGILEMAEGSGLSTVTLDEEDLETFRLPRKTCYQIISGC